MEYIIGVVVSLVVQFVKKRFTGDYERMLVVLLFSFMGAATYVLIKDLPIFPSLVQVATTAGAMYAFVWRRFETSK